MNRIIALLVCLAVVVSLLPASTVSASSPAAPAASPSAASSRYFAETGFNITNDKFWDYFQKRGSLRTHGYPVSREFTLLGTQVQIFQRRILQIQPDGSVGQLNLFDPQFMPYTSINGSTLPAADPALVNLAPAPGSPNYAADILAFVQKYALNTVGTTAVKFYDTFVGSVSYAEAYPTGGPGAGIMPLINLEMWGVPTSAPAADPNNGNFIYLRFQRGVMHHDKTNGTTQGMLLADYFKSVITGENLPGDLDAAAKGSAFYRQYNNGNANGLNNGGLLANTNMKDAFEKEGPLTPPAPTPQPPPGPPPSGTSGLRYGMQAHLYQGDRGRTLDMLTGAGFGWMKQQIRWEHVESSPGSINWGDLDPIVDAAAARGVKLLFSVVTTPSWARADQRSDGPPDNYALLGDFIAKLAARYKGRVQAYEVWNEQNFTREWGGGTINAGQYVELLKAAYPRIKAADPAAIVISGALTPTGVNDPNIAIDDAAYMAQMFQYQGGIIRDYCDAIGAHMAGYNNAPEDWMDLNTVNTPGFKGHPSFYFRRIDQLADVMRVYGINKQMWITEYEWASYPGPVPGGYEWTTHLSEGQVADFLVRSIQMIQASRPWVGAVFVWNLNWRTFADPRSDESAIFGILNSDYSPRAMYTSLKNMPK